MKSLLSPLMMTEILDFQVMASSFLSFSSPPAALMALSRMAFGSLSSARAGNPAADTKMIARAAPRNGFMEGASIRSGGCPTRTIRVPASARAIVATRVIILRDPRRLRQGVTYASLADILVPERWMRADERLHQPDAFGIVEHLQDDPARPEIGLGALERPVLADEDFGDSVQERRARAHVAGRERRVEDGAA